MRRSVDAGDSRAARMSPPAVTVVGDVVDLRETLSWFETKALFGWRVLVPRTKEQAGAMSARLRAYGAIPCEVPTIAVEPPRTPAQMERAVKGLVDGRYAWTLVTALAIGYMLSRGIAKSGKGTYADD